MITICTLTCIQDVQNVFFNCVIKSTRCLDKGFCLCVYCVYLSYKYKHMHAYILEKYVVFIY